MLFCWLKLECHKSVFAYLKNRKRAQQRSRRKRDRERKRERDRVVTGTRKEGVPGQLSSCSFLFSPFSFSLSTSRLAFLMGIVLTGTGLELTPPRAAFGLALGLRAYSFGALSLLLAVCSDFRFRLRALPLSIFDCAFYYPHAHVS